MRFKTVLPIGLSALSLAWNAAAFPTTDPQEAGFRSNAYLIEFATPPDHPQAAQDAARFMESIKNFRSVHVRHQFKTLLNGVSVEITDPAELQQVQTMESLHSLTPLSIVAPPLPSQPSTNALVTDSLKLTSVNRVHSELGLTGEGVKVGVIDTGIDYTHPDLGGCFGAGCKVAFGWDFVGDDYTGSNKPKPSGDPRDCAGHGTHVAGIIAANGSVVTGVAPGATLGAYRVIGCNGSTTDDMIIAAMERAVDDGMDVINMSLGEPNGWFPNPVGRAVLRASKRGVLVAAAQGNEANVGLFGANYVGVGTGVLAVASTLVALMNGTSPSQACAPLPESVKLDGKLVLVLRGECFFKVKAQNVLERGAVGVIFINNVPGTVVPSTEGVKATTGSISQKDGMHLVDLLLKTGSTEQQGYLTASATITFDPNVAVLLHPAGGSLSDFSSYGLDNDLHIKPDVGAPGESIYSTWLSKNGSYTSLSGTSMASPHAAGALALAVESLRKQGMSKPTTKKREAWVRRIYDAFTISAKPARVFRDHRPADSGDLEFVDENSTREPKTDESQAIESVAKQGGGLIDVYRTILRLEKPASVDDTQTKLSPFSSTRVLPVMLELNDTTPRQEPSKPTTLTIYNEASVAVVYEISHVAAEALNEPLIEPHEPHQTLYEGAFSTATPLVLTAKADAEVTFSSNSVTVPAGKSRRITVQINPPPSLPADEHWIYSGYIVIRPSATPSAPSSDEAIHIPYAGVKGSMKTLPIFLQTTPEHEILSNNASQICQVLGSLQEGKEQLIFSLKDNDYPAISICLENPTRRMELDLLDKDGKLIGHLGADDNVGRSSPTKPTEVFAWDGTYDPPNSHSKSTSTILDDSGITGASFFYRGQAERVGPQPESVVAPSSTTKRDTILQERDLSPIKGSDKDKIAVSDGFYQFRLRGLRLFGDRSKEDDFEAWVFPMFQIVRT
ncbi:hypothetical protein DFQ27_009062 [Actinomortierella ambigua]|uniref:Uncharacterized protein n=1 Tax=Actinomortierella ambigua TaxID=1343610 RepID=A0A9P6QP18_9FUNG|nr:hypothetical protein DFQ27_009062 [Actinomortierella ambigua]